MTKLLWLDYLLEASLILCLFFGLYKGIYERLGHYRFNRIVLAAGLFLVLLIPLVHIPIHLGLEAPGWQDMNFTPLEVLEYDMPIMPASAVVAVDSIDWSQLGFVLYLGGLLCFLLFRITQLLVLQKRVSRATPSPYGEHIFCLRCPATFSFGRRIYLGKDFVNQSAPGREMMLKHEQTHIDQKHRIDLFIFHLAHCLLWFHPLMPAWGRALRQQHEFLADQASIRQFHNPKAYARLLLSLSSGKSSPFTHAFAFFTLKKRITMLFKTSTKVSKWPYVIMIPVVGLLLCSFSFNQKSAPVSIIETTQPSDHIPSLRPVDAEIVSGFGMRYNPLKKAKQHHRGVDIRANIGAPVYAPADGIVAEIKDFGNDGYGKLLTISHGDEFVTRYAHLSAFEVEEGDQVARGEVVARVGNTGRSLGPHLHYEVLKNGEHVDPEPYFTEY